MRIKEMASSERPREKLLKTGAEYLSNSELLGILIGSGDREHTAVEIASELLNSDARGLANLADISCEELKRFHGIGDATTCRIAACMEIAKRLSAVRPHDRLQLNGPDAVASFLMVRMRYYREEHFAVMLMDTRGHVMSVEEVAVGSSNVVGLHPGEVFRPAVRRGAPAVILTHNHPSGDPDPSDNDISTTDRMNEAGRVLGIRTLDHIIIGNGTYFSFKENGMMR